MSRRSLTSRPDSAGPAGIQNGLSAGVDDLPQSGEVLIFTGAVFGDFDHGAAELGKRLTDVGCDFPGVVVTGIGVDEDADSEEFSPEPGVTGQDARLLVIGKAGPVKESLSGERIECRHGIDGRDQAGLRKVADGEQFIGIISGDDSLRAGGDEFLEELPRYGGVAAVVADEQFHRAAVETDPGVDLLGGEADSVMEAQSVDAVVAGEGKDGADADRVDRIDGAVWQRRFGTSAEQGCDGGSGCCDQVEKKGFHGEDSPLALWFCRMKTISVVRVGAESDQFGVSGHDAAFGVADEIDEMADFGTLEIG